MVKKKDNRIIMGVDFGEGLFKAILLEKDKKKNKFNLLKCFKTKKNQGIKDSDKQDTDVEILQECLKSFNLKISPQVYFTFSNPSVVVRYATMPKMPASELKNALEWKFKNAFPFELSQAYSNYWVGANIGSEQEQFIVYLAIVKDLIDEKVALLRKVGMEADGFGLPTLAMAEAFEQIPTDDSAVIVFDLGHFTSNISIIYKRQSVFSRVVSTGCYHLEEALKTVFVSDRGAIKFTEREVSEILYEVGVFETQPEFRYKGITSFQIMALLRPVLERLESEVSRSGDYLKQTVSGVNVKKILMCGGGAKIKNFDVYLSKTTGLDIADNIKVPWLNLPKEKPGEKTEFYFPEYVLAAGIAKGGLKTALPLSVRVSKSFPQIELFLLRALVIGLIVLNVLVSFSLFILGSVTNSKMNYFNRKIKEFDWVYTYLQKKDTKKATEDLFKKSSYDTKKISSFLWFLGNEIPKEVMLESLILENRENKVRIKGFVYRGALSAEEELANFMQGIKDMKEFGNPQLKLEKVRSDLDERPIYFELEVIGEKNR